MSLADTAGAPAPGTPDSQALQDGSSTSPTESLRVGYVLKRYPHYAESSIVAQILGHEAGAPDGSTADRVAAP